jgi:SAM-dependent methyltransferase
MPVASKDFKSKLRFTNRAENYNKYRPKYPKALFTWVEDKLGPGLNRKVADLGSGTGIFSQHLLNQGYEVYAVEPNKEMRRMAETKIQDSLNFFSVQGEAEATGLGEQSVDLVTSAQAFHWFGTQKTVDEIRRILKDHGKVLLVWNIRDYENDPFQKGYENLMADHCREYKDVHHTYFDKDGLGELFRASRVQKMSFPNFQIFDLEGLIGRTESCSYCPLPEDEFYGPLIEGITKLYSRYQRQGRVDFKYITESYLISL